MLSFLNSAVLIGLAGVALPLFIHLFARKRNRVIPFSSLRFLKILQNHTLRRVNLRQWLLLALRMLALLLMVLAFAQPVFKSAGNPSSKAPASILMVVDRSMSMSRQGLRPVGESVERVLALTGDGDEVSLMWSVPPRGDLPLNWIPASAADSWRNRVQETPVSFQPGDLLSRLQDAALMMQNASHVNREIYLISDMQNSAFPPPEDTTVCEWNGPLYVLNHTGMTANTAVVSGELKNRMLESGMMLKLQAEITHFGSGSSETLCRLFIGGQAVDQRRVELKDHTRVPVLLQTPLNQTGWISGEVTLEEDGMNGDNRWFFAFYVPRRKRLLIVGTSDADIRPIQRALDVRADAEEGYRILAFTGSGDWTRRLAGVDGVILSNPATLSLDSQRQLADFIQNGGGCVFLPGKETDLRAWGEYLLQPLAGITPGNPEVGGTGYFALDRVDDTHPLFDGVFEKKNPSIQSPRFKTYVPFHGDALNPVMAFRGGLPFLLDRSMHRGRLLVYAAGVAPEWSNWTTTSLFLPLITRSAAYITSGGGALLKTSRVGVPVTLSLGKMELKYPLMGRHPEEVIRLRPEFVGGETRVSFIPEYPGIYRLFHGDSLVAAQAVNVHPRESDLRPISPKRLNALFPKAQIRWISPDQEIQRQVLSARYGREWWPFLLGAALFLLAVEQLLSRGNFRRGKED